MESQVASLQEQLQSNQMQKIEAAIATIKESEPDPTSTDLLIQTLAHRIWRARKLAAECLRQRVAFAFPQLSDSIQDSNHHIRYWTIQILPKAGEQAIPLLTGCYDRLSIEDQLFILKAIATIRSEKSIPFALAQLAREEYSVRREASRILEELGSRSVPSLKELLRSGTDHQRFWAFRLIGKIVGRKALPTFQTILFSEDYDEKIKSYALSGLKEIGTPETVETLMQVLDSDLWALRAQASKVLMHHPTDCTLELLAALKDRNKTRRYWLTQILLERICPKYLGHLEELFRESDAELRYQTLSLIASLQSADAAAVLCQAFQDPIWYIRKQAADLLYQMGSVSIHPLAQTASEGDEESLFWTCRVLGRLAHTAGLKSLEGLLENTSKEIRLHALDAIANITEEQAVHLLIKAFGNDFWVVRSRASEHLIERMEQAGIPLLMQIHSSNESVAYWVSKTFEECHHPGLKSMAAIFSELGPSECKTVAEHLNRLRGDVLQELFQRFGLDRMQILEKLNSIQNLNSSSILGPRIDDSPIHPLERSDFRHEQEERFKEILTEFTSMGGATLQLRIGATPMARVNGVLCKCTNYKLSPLDIQEFLLPWLDGDLLRELGLKGRLEFSFPFGERQHFRVHMTRHNQGHEAVIHRMRSTLPDFEELKLPTEFLESVARLPRGLVLISGPACSGKSLLILSLLAHINRHAARSILTYEDEVEHPLEGYKSVISQRRFGAAFESWEDIMPTLAREDADVVYMGRTPDFPSAETLLHLATSKTLVLLESSAASTRDAIDKMISAFPPAQSQIYCKLLQKSLAASIHIRLVHRADESGMIPALEFFMNHPSISSRLTPEGLEEMHSILQKSEGSKTAMSLDEYLMSLASEGEITYQEAVRHMEDKSKVSISQIW